MRVSTAATLRRDQIRRLHAGWCCSCDDAQINFYDSIEQTQQVLSSNFTMRKIAGSRYHLGAGAGMTVTPRKPPNWVRSARRCEWPTVRLERTATRPDSVPRWRKPKLFDSALSRNLLREPAEVLKLGGLDHHAVAEALTVFGLPILELRDAEALRAELCQKLRFLHDRICGETPHPDGRSSAPASATR